MLQNIQDFGPQELASILHTMAKARYHSKQVLAALKGRAEALAGTFNAQHVANQLQCSLHDPGVPPSRWLCRTLRKAVATLRHHTSVSPPNPSQPSHPACHQHCSLERAQGQNRAHGNLPLRGLPLRSRKRTEEHVECHSWCSPDRTVRSRSPPLRRRRRRRKPPLSEDRRAQHRLAPADNIATRRASIDRRAGPRARMYCLVVGRAL